MSENDLKARIKAQLLKSGFPLELRCRREILQHRWGLAMARFYADSEGFVRETDAIGHKGTGIGPNSAVFSYVLVECKKSEDKPWVFFCEGRGQPTALNVVSTLEALQHQDIAHGMWPKESILRQHHYAGMDLAISYCVAFRDEKGDAKKAENQIFEGLQQLFRRYRYERARLDKASKTDGRTGGFLVSVYYPVLVLDGRLFVAALAGEDLEVSEVKRVLYKEEHSFHSGFSTTAVDVVCADSFGQYLTLLDQDHEIVLSYIRGKFPNSGGNPPQSET